MGKRFAFLLLLLFPLLGFAQRKPVPDFRGLVNDYAAVLSAADAAQIEAKLRAYEDSTSTQIAVVIETSLNGRDEFDRAMDFGRAWNPGQRGKRNGVVMYIAIEDRKIFILNAEGVQGALTDAVTYGIIDQFIKPRFREQDYFGGINAGIDGIILALKGEFKPEKKKSKDISPLAIFIIIIVGFTILSIISRRGGGGGLSGRGPYWFPGPWIGGGWGGGGGSSSGGGWGGFGGGGGFNGGGAGGSW